MDLLNEAKSVFDIEINALNTVRNSLSDSFLTIVNKITECKGKIIIIGIGKSGHIGRKIASTFSSLGTPSFFLHPAEALHGDLGMIESNDIVIAISYSGESDEILRIISSIKAIGAFIIGISGNENSTLVKHCNAYQILNGFDEACYMGLAPTSSTTAVLVFGDALAITAAKIYGFNKENFKLLHPAGSLGKKLILKVNDLMSSGQSNPTIREGDTLKSAIVELGEKGLGIVNVIDDQQNVLGVITDGDLRRQLEKGVDVYNKLVNEVMTLNPKCVQDNTLAIESLQYLKENNISCAPVVNEKRELVGTIRLQDLLNSGIVL